mgnify:CR=1 FL=1
MKYILLRDVIFHNNGMGFFTLKKGSVYNSVSAHHYDKEINNAVIRERRSRKKRQIVILKAEGQQRIFEIGVDVAPHTDSFGTFRRIKRCKEKVTRS